MSTDQRERSRSRSPIQFKSSEPPEDKESINSELKNNVEEIKVIDPIKVVEPIQDVDVEPAKAVESYKVVEPTKTAEPANAVESIKVVEPIKAPKPTKTVEPIKIVETTKAAEPTKTVQSIKVVEPIKTAVSTKAVEPIKVEEPTKAAESTKTVEPIKTTEQTKAVEPVNVDKPIKTVEPTKAAEPIKAVKPTKAVEPIRDTETVKIAEPAKDAEPIKDVKLTKDLEPTDDDIVKEAQLLIQQFRDEIINNSNLHKDAYLEHIESSINETMKDIESILESEIGHSLLDDSIENESMESESIKDVSMTDPSTSGEPPPKKKIKRSSSPEVLDHVAATDCRAIYIKGLPKGWSYQTIKTFLSDRVSSIDLRNRLYFVVIMKDEQLKETGEVLIKFRTAAECELVFKDLKKSKMDKIFTVKLDIGNVFSNQAKLMGNKKTNIQELKAMNSMNPMDKYANIKKKHEDTMRSHQTEVKSEDSESVQEFNNKFDAQAMQQKVQQNNFPPLAKGFMRSEILTMDTYGLSPSFLESLGISPPFKSTVVLTRLDPRIDEKKLREVFSLAGLVRRIMMPCKKDGTPKHLALIEYDHPVEAVQAISMFRGRELYGREIHIDMDIRKAPKSLPLGLKSIGRGLGRNGQALRGVRTVIELQTLKEVLLKSGTIDNVASAFENSPFENTIQIGPKSATNAQNPTTETSNQSNLLLGLTTLLQAQNALQQNSGTDLTSFLSLLQNQNTNAAPAVQNAPNHHQSNIPARGQVPRNLPQPPPPRARNMPPGRPPNIPQTGPNFSQNVPQSVFSQNTPNYQNPTPTFSQNAPVHGYNQNAPTFTPNYQNPAPGFNQNAPAFNQSSPTFNQSAPTYSRNMPSYNPPVGQIISDWKVQAPLPVPPVQSQAHYEAEHQYYKPQTSFDDNSRFDSPKYEKELPDSRHKEEPSDKKGSDMLIFSNLPSSVTVQALNVKMQEVGELMFGEMTGKGRAIVRFKHNRDAERCVKLFNRSKVDGQIIDVKFF